MQSRFTRVFKRSFTFKPLYTANVTSTGGRSGKSVSSDGLLNIELSLPKALGGKEDKTNPEQLFAAGYSACFIGAMGVAAGQLKLKLDPKSTVNALVHIGSGEKGGFMLKTELRVHIPGLSKEDATKVVEQAHMICPYSVATRGALEVKLTVI